jgi:hypothetical protein
VPLKLTHALAEYEGADPEAVLRAVAVVAFPVKVVAVTASLKTTSPVKVWEMLLS